MRWVRRSRSERNVTVLDEGRGPGHAGVSLVCVLLDFSLATMILASSINAWLCNARRVARLKDRMCAEKFCWAVAREIGRSSMRKGGLQVPFLRSLRRDLSFMRGEEWDGVAECRVGGVLAGATLRVDRREVVLTWDYGFGRSGRVSVPAPWWIRDRLLEGIAAGSSDVVSSGAGERYLKGKRHVGRLPDEGCEVGRSSQARSVSGGGGGE